MLKRSRLKEVLYYHPESGDFVWYEKTGQSTPVGKQAGTLMDNGYIAIRIDGQAYLAHRLAVFYVIGDWPKHEVDHRDTVKHHNWWSNLREATSLQNKHNTGLNSANKSGFKNVSWDKTRNIWQVRMRVNGKMRRFGEFIKLADAATAAEAARVAHHGTFVRH